MSSNSRQAHSTSGFWRRSPAYVPSKIDIIYSGVGAQVGKPDSGRPSSSTLAQAAAAAVESTDAALPLAPPPVAGSEDETSQQQEELGTANGIDTALNPGVIAADPHEQKFHALLSASNVDIEQLQKQSWKGIPSKHRSTAWCLLMGYFPLNAGRRELTIQRKRKEYDDWVRQTFSRGEEALDRTLWHQICIDVPRTTPGSALFQNERIQRSLERVLYCWAVRHPASGYVQGINDLLTPFYYVFIEPHLLGTGDQETAAVDVGLVSGLADKDIGAVEADSFWCLTKLLDGIQDNYTHAQPGIQRQIIKMKELVARIDGPLAAHMDSEGVEYIQFAFRWINCLLMREVRLSSTIRMWDTYLAEADGFSTFHIYVCAAFLLKWSKTIQQLDFQQTLLFLQKPPTESWTGKDIELLLSEAYMYKCLYHNSPKHYQ